MIESRTKTEWTVEELWRRLGRGDPFYLLDVRNRDEYGAWRIEGRVPLASRNEPYFELVESAASDDPAEVAKALMAGAGATPLPREGELLAVCAKGGASDFVARGLRELGYPATNLAGGMEAWAAFYDVRPVHETADLSLFQVSRPARGCLSWVVSSRGEALVVDALRHAERYLELAAARGLRIAAVLDTHAHADHVSGGPTLARRAGTTYHLHPYDAIHPMDLLPGRIDYEPLRGGQRLRVGAVEVEVLHIPGHTLGNLAFLVGEEWLLTGDSIFLDSIARPDLGGRGESWAALHHASLRRLLGLPDGVRVLPGHFTTPAEADEAGRFVKTIGELRHANDGLRTAQLGREEFVSWVLARLPNFPPQYVDIKRVNLGLAPADEERASELEIGKNVCAMAHA
jgi:glyoxylase-like metal-dependent hydrolase (beta-lactamase superfamily II)